MRIGYGYGTKVVVLRGDGCEKYLKLTPNINESSFNDRADVVVTDIILTSIIEKGTLKGVHAAPESRVL